MNIRNTLLAGAAVLALAAGSAQAKEMTFAFQGDANSMDPYNLNETFTLGFMANIYEGLIRRGPNLEIEPSLAVSWEIIEPTRWRFHLRKGVKFHGGEDFTADDVLFSADRVRGDGSDLKTRLAGVTDIIKVDDHTVDFVTEAANPILHFEWATWAIMSKTWAEKNGAVSAQSATGDQENFATRNANGTGPFQLVSRAPDELTELAAFDGWWGKGMFPGNIDKIEYRPITNAATRVAALLFGEVDFVLDPPLQDLKRIEGADGLKVSTVAQIRSIFFGMDQGVDELRSSDVKGKNPFKDKRVREAFNLAINKKAIQRVVMEGLSFPTAMITPPGVLGNTPELDESYGFDVAKAKSLMEEAGYGNGFSIQLDCPNNRYNNDEKICQAAVAMLAKIGVKVNLDAIPKAQHFPKIQNRTSDFYMLGWGVPTLDSHYVFSYLLDSEGSWNATGYNNARVNEITKLITTETDLDKRTALIDEAHNLLSSIEAIHSNAVSGSLLERAHAQLHTYHARYKGRLHPKNLA